MSASDEPKVKQRCVFYVSGFDPKGASHYHALFRDHGKLQSERAGWRLEVGPRKRLANGNASWAIRSEIDGRSTSTHYEFLRWDDIVRKHWPTSLMVLWWRVITTTLFNLRHGSLWRMYRLSWPPAMVAFMPFLLVIGVVLGAPAVAAAIVAMLSALSVATAPAWGAGLAVFALAAWAARRLEAHYAMHWLTRSYAFTARHVRGQVPELEARLDEHARRLVARVASAQDDEVLLVGHSSGANQAASIMARALRLDPMLLKGKTRVSLLTLGQWLPLSGTPTIAHRFRDELRELARAQGLEWIDFSAPPDGCCFALCNPFDAMGITLPPKGQRLNFKCVNPRFAEMFSPEKYLALKKDKLRLHFQYVSASDRATDYDYFMICAGPLTLAQRFSQAAGVENYSALRGMAWLGMRTSRLRLP